MAELIHPETRDYLASRGVVLLTAGDVTIAAVPTQWNGRTLYLQTREPMSMTISASVAEVNVNVYDLLQEKRRVRREALVRAHDAAQRLRVAIRSSVWRELHRILDQLVAREAPDGSRFGKDNHQQDRLTLVAGDRQLLYVHPVVQVYAIGEESSVRESSRPEDLLPADLAEARVSIELRAVQAPGVCRYASAELDFNARSLQSCDGRDLVVQQISPKFCEILADMLDKLFPQPAGS